METLFVLPLAIFLAILTLLFAVMAVAINQQKHKLRDDGQDPEIFLVDRSTHKVSDIDFERSKI